jgi:hypothetical protein
LILDVARAEGPAAVRSPRWSEDSHVALLRLARRPGTSGAVEHPLWRAIEQALSQANGPLSLGDVEAAADRLRRQLQDQLADPDVVRYDQHVPQPLRRLMLRGPMP